MDQKWKKTTVHLHAIRTVLCDNNNTTDKTGVKHVKLASIHTLSLPFRTCICSSTVPKMLGTYCQSLVLHEVTVLILLSRTVQYSTVVQCTVHFTGILYVCTVYFRCNMIMVLDWSSGVTIHCMSLDRHTITVCRFIQ